MNPDDTIDVSEPPDAALPPDAVFDETPVGSRVSELVTLGNDGGSPLDVVHVAVDGEGFSLGIDDCAGASLAPGDTCDVEVIFEPQREGSFEGVLAMEFAGFEPASVVLEATAVVSLPTTSPSPTTSAPAVPTTPPTVTTTSPTTPDPTETTSPPASSTPPTTVPIETGDAAALRACDERAADAQVVYEPRHEMTVGVESEVVVVIVVGGTTPPPPTGSTPSPVTTIVPTRLTCFIELELSGTGFQIESAVQTGDFASAPAGRWSWDVTPERSGRLDLKLKIAPKLHTPSGFQNGTPRDFTAAITVTAAPRTGWQQIGDVSGGVATHPLFQIAVAAGLVGGIGPFVKKLVARGRAQRDTTDSSADGPGGYL